MTDVSIFCNRLENLKCTHHAEGVLDGISPDVGARAGLQARTTELCAVGVLTEGLDERLHDGELRKSDGLVGQAGDGRDVLVTGRDSNVLEGRRLGVLAVERRGGRGVVGGLDEGGGQGGRARSLWVGDRRGGLGKAEACEDENDESEEHDDELLVEVRHDWMRRWCVYRSRWWVVGGRWMPEAGS